MRLNYSRTFNNFEYNRPSEYLRKPMLGDVFNWGFQVYQSGIAYYSSTGGYGSSSLPTNLCSLSSTQTDFEGYLFKQSRYADYGTRQSYTTYTKNPNPFSFADGTPIQDQPLSWTGTPFVVPSIDGFVAEGKNLIYRGKPTPRENNSNAYVSAGAYRPYSYCDYAGIPPENYTQLSKFDETERDEILESYFAFREHNVFTVASLFEQEVFGLPGRVKVPIAGYNPAPFDPNPVIWQPLNYRRESESPTSSNVTSDKTYYGKFFRDCDDKLFGQSGSSISNSVPRQYLRRTHMLDYIRNPAQYQLDNLGNHNCIDNGGEQFEAVSPNFFQLGWNDVDQFGISYQPASGTPGGSGSIPNPYSFFPTRFAPSPDLCSDPGGGTGGDAREVINGCVSYYDEFLTPDDPPHPDNIGIYGRLSQQQALTQLAPANGGIDFRDSGKCLVHVQCDPINEGTIWSTFANYTHELTGFVDLTVVPQEYDWSGNGTLCPNQDWTPE